jgi:DNA modification methylase
MVYYESLVCGTTTAEPPSQPANDPRSEPMQVITGDASSVLSLFPKNHFDAVVCDPPYGLSNYPPAMVNVLLARWAAGRDYDYSGRKGVLGEEWDGGVPNPSIFADVLRVLKPGGHAVVFVAPATQDLMMVSLRLAGFEIRDVFAWIQSQGFPKARNIGLEIDKMLGVSNATSDGAAPRLVADICGKNYAKKLKGEIEHRKVAYSDKKAQSPQGKQWDGWRAGLKQGNEPIILVRKPCVGSVAKNVLNYGTGALNIDACRIPLPPGESLEVIGDGRPLDTRGMGYGFRKMSRAAHLGRYPANVIGEFEPDIQKFFYCPKVSPGEKDKHVPADITHRHPCLKPVKLMAELSRLVCPPGGTILDPFCGWGSAGIGAVLEGFSYLGIEQDPEYARVARHRIEGWYRERETKKAA